MINKRKFIRFILIVFTWILCLVTGITYLVISRKTDIRSIKNLVKKEQVLKKEIIKIYFPNKDFTALDSSNEEIVASESHRDKIERIVIKNIDVLKGKGFLKNDKIDVNNIYMLNDTVYISFSFSINELEAENKKNVAIITAIVDSVTEVPSVTKVKFLVNGGDGAKSLNKFYTRKLKI